ASVPRLGPAPGRGRLELLLVVLRPPAAAWLLPALVLLALVLLALVLLALVLLALVLLTILRQDPAPSPLKERSCGGARGRGAATTSNGNRMQIRRSPFGGFSRE